MNDNLDPIQSATGGDTTFVILGLALLGLIFGFIFYYLVKVRAERVEREFEMAARAFENQIIRDYNPPPKLGGAGAQAQTLDPPAESEPVTEEPINQPSDEVFPAPPLAETEASGPAFRSLKNESPIVQDVVAKLTAAGLYDHMDGPVRSNNPYIKGVIIKLTRGGHLAVLESAIRERDPDLANLVRMYDGVITPGPGDEAVIVKPFSKFISDQFSL